MYSLPKNKQTNKRFQEAVIYAKSAFADPATKQTYADKATGNLTAYNGAIADLFNTPEIEPIYRTTPENWAIPLRYEQPTISK